jgi:hypothetical protein
VDKNCDAQIMAPASSNLEPSEYPPYSQDWYKFEDADFPANAPARVLAHQARSVTQANWPSLKVNNPASHYLNACRSLSNELADAALYQHLHGDDAAAIETLRDQLRLGDSLVYRPDKTFVSLLVGIGIRAECVNRLEVITAGIALSNDPKQVKSLQSTEARKLIAQLLDHSDAKTQLDQTLVAEGTPNTPSVAALTPRMMFTINRVNMEVDMAAMSLACHVYRFDTGNWPNSLDDLHPYLPRIPIDPWGDGKQSLGYVLIKAGLPDGSDRPLAYSRCNAKDGLFFRLDKPCYSFYTGDGSQLPSAQQKQGGQFRDVASWIPVDEGDKNTTQALP